MKAFLMHRDRDFDLKQALPWNEAALVQDLALDTLFDAMAQGDPFLRDVARKALLCAMTNDADTILYRQAILQDCLQQPALLQDLYGLAVEAIEAEKKAYFYSYFAKYPGAILDRSIEVLHVFVGMLKRLRALAAASAHLCASQGLTTFFAMLEAELSDAYFATVEEHLKRLKLREGALISASLGKGAKGVQYTLRKPPPRSRNWLRQVFSEPQPSFSYTIPNQDENGAKALSELRDRGINEVANALAQSCDHILSFFVMLRTELAFYVGCLNLRAALVGMGLPVCIPEPAPPTARRHTFRNAYDVGLALVQKQGIVGNDLAADGKELVIITGANQGGKSTFLRSIGQCQLMLQCGMFAPADSFSANLCDGLFTHYRREEDATMTSGKLDEELSRMSEIVDQLTPHPLLLFNESFAATNDREGSEIARQIVSALRERHMKIFFVTHLFEFAHGVFMQQIESALFLRAERQPDGTRTFRLAVGAPLQTSFGADLYRQVFGAAQPAAQPAPQPAPRPKPQPEPQPAPRAR